MEVNKQKQRPNRLMLILAGVGEMLREIAEALYSDDCPYVNDRLDRDKRIHQQKKDEEL